MKKNEVKMKIRKRNVKLLLLLILFIIIEVMGVILFAKAFFPSKQPQLGFSPPNFDSFHSHLSNLLSITENDINNANNNTNNITNNENNEKIMKIEPVFDRLVLMVVDAMRADFVLPDFRFPTAPHNCNHLIFNLFFISYFSLFFYF